jgi:tetratricopeptide (TPR) repeat protein
VRTARAYADSTLPEFEQAVREGPEDGVGRLLLGLSLAHAGRTAEAVREGERGVELQPPAEDAFVGPYLQQQLARIYLLAGRPDEALDRLEPLLQVPHTLSPGWLRVDPTWDPLRGQSRFQVLVREPLSP